VRGEGGTRAPGRREARPEEGWRDGEFCADPVKPARAAAWTARAAASKFRLIRLARGLQANLRRVCRARGLSEGKGVPVSDFEESLLALDARLEKVQKLEKAVAAAIARARTAVKTGQAAEIEKGLAAIGQRIAEADTAAVGLAEEWNFDTAAYLSDGRFLDDLKAAAKEQGLAMFESDGRIYCFPLLLRIEPKETAVKIGRRVERRLRPSELARLLARAQKRPQRFREQQFLELLYRTWRRLVGAAWHGSGRGPVVALSDIHDTLTLLPGADYPSTEFARDLLLLDRKPALRTRDGCRFEFPASTLGKGRMKRIVVYDEDGGEHTYIGLRFVKDS
jgi:hypothetical protein